MDSAGVSVIKAFHVHWLKGERGGREREREREGEKALAGTLCSLFTLSLTNLVHRWPTIISLCAHCRWRATSFSEIGVILYYLWLSGIFGSRLNTICWITERSRRQQSGMKCKQREWKWRSRGIHNEDVMLTVSRNCSWIQHTLIPLTLTKYTICFKLASGGVYANRLDAPGDFWRLLEGTG